MFWLPWGMRVSAEGAPQPALRVILLAKSWCLAGRLSVNRGELLRYLALTCKRSSKERFQCWFFTVAWLLFFCCLFVFKQEFHFYWGIGSLQCYSQGGTGGAGFLFWKFIITKSSIVDHLECFLLKPKYISKFSVDVLGTFWWGANLVWW